MARWSRGAFEDGSLRGSSRDIEFPDGRKMNLGGSSDSTGPAK